MEFNDEQFQQFMKAFEIRDMVVRIDENTKNFRKQFDDHTKEDHEALSVQNRSLEKVHLRIDTVRDEQRKLRFMIVGAGLVISAVVVIVNLVLNFYNSRLFMETRSVENSIRHS